MDDKHHRIFAVVISFVMMSRFNNKINRCPVLRGDGFVEEKTKFLVIKIIWVSVVEKNFVLSNQYFKKILKKMFVETQKRKSLKNSSAAKVR